MSKRSRLSELLHRRGAAAKKLTNITIETHELLVLRRGSLVRSWCPACADEVEMLPAEQAAVAAGVNLLSVCREVEAGNLHYTETEGGILLICLSSLLNQR